MFEAEIDIGYVKTEWRQGLALVNDFIYADLNVLIFITQWILERNSNLNCRSAHRMCDLKQYFEQIT
jgi:hypothetical protein